MRIQSKVLRRKRLAEPLHVVLDEDLDNFAADAPPALEGPPNAAARGHVCAKLHIAKAYEMNSDQPS
jgi:hypothetical protein